MALIFAIGSVQRTVSKAEETVNREDLRYSPYLSEAPDKKAEIQPPPNPDLLPEPEDSFEELALENLELEKKVEPITLKPIEVEIEVKMPDGFAIEAKPESSN